MMKLKAAFLGCTFLAVMGAAQGQLYFGADPFATGQGQTPLNRDFRLTCEAIAKTISPASQVFFPGTPEFQADISHWANSSTQVATCSVRPGKAEDVGLILRELASSRTPFAIRCSGHTTNPHFSSTRGIQISMIRFNDIVVHEKEGYSWKTNQYGLTVDTLTAIELVLPNGKVVKVTEKNKDLWFALKGGLNNYGIVTKFTLKTHKQTDVWGAVLNFEGDLIKPAYTAFANFLAKGHDHKGAQLGHAVYSNGTVEFGIVLFYDAPKPPAGLYDDLLDFSNSSKTIIEGSFVDFVLSLPPPIPARGYFDGVPMLRYSAPVLKAAIDDLQSWGDRISQYDKDTVLVFGLDAFEDDIFTHGGPSAFPPDRSHTVLPSSLFFTWTDESLDGYMYDNLRALSAELIQAGIKDGQDLEHAARYSNYALFGTPLEQIYGENVPRLREIKERYDPHRVMDLTGGFKF
ncbi:hypothetical protein BJV77DRAFT_960317 [Russula vinacea]|nr:hypothetical protein BJV77DRAFT_960317 [Russula vinacea]